MGLDYYAILNIPRNCTSKEIKLAYRKYAIASHPERKPYPMCPQNPPEGVPEEILHLPSLPKDHIWKLVNEAYDVLINPLLRQIYDVYGEEGVKRGTCTPCGYVQPYPCNKDYMKTYIKAFGSSSPYVDLVDAVINPPPLCKTDQGMAVRVKDKTIRTELHLTLQEIFYGTMKKVKIFRKECNDDDCTKTSVREKIIVINIPPGTLPGSEFKFPNEGDRGTTRFPADIIFVTVDLPHLVFTRHKADLHMTHKIELLDSLSGFVIRLTTIDDRLLNIPITDVVNPGYVKKIKNEGIPYEFDIKKKGDLYIHFETIFPQYISKIDKDNLKKCLKSIKEHEIKMKAEEIKIIETNIDQIEKKINIHVN